MKIKLPILFNTYQTQNLQNNDIYFDLRECEIRQMIFYSIGSIAPYFENDIEYCQIFSHGQSFYSTLKVKEVEKAIETN